MAEISARLELKGWNATQLKLRVPIILEAYGTVMDKQLKEEIKTIQFEWPNDTIRYGRLRETKSLKKSLQIFQEQGFRAGVRVGSPRDIVDSGNFLRSQQKNYERLGNTLRFTWNAKSKKGFMYAGIILTGYTTSSGKAMPPRNWIKPALDKHPLNEFFIREWRALAGSRL